MYIEPKDIIFKTGQKVILKSPEAADAAALLEYMRQISEETHYMLRYPEEICISVEQERDYIQSLIEDEKSFMLAAFVEGELAGNVGVNQLGSWMKIRHRGELGIALKEKFFNLGLGSILVKEALHIARNAGFEQVELGVFADNPRAIHVYEKLGFKRTGVIPGAYKLKNNVYCEEIQMIYHINAESE